MAQTASLLVCTWQGAGTQPDTTLGHSFQAVSDIPHAIVDDDDMGVALQQLGACVGSTQGVVALSGFGLHMQRELIKATAALLADRGPRHARTWPKHAFFQECSVKITHITLTLLLCHQPDPVKQHFHVSAGESVSMAAMSTQDWPSQEAGQSFHVCN